MTHCRVNKSYDSKRMGKLWHWTSCTKINRLWFPELRRICPKSVWYLNLAKYCLRIAFSLVNGSFQKFPQMCALCKISERSVDWKVVKDRRDFARFQFTKVFFTDSLNRYMPLFMNNGTGLYLHRVSESSQWEIPRTVYILCIVKNSTVTA